jgi:hypothetical protein
VRTVLGVMLWRFSSHLLSSGCVCLAILGACSSSDAPLDAGSPVVDASFEAVAPSSEGGTCDDCGAPRFTAECTAAQTACLNDVGCASIRNCVFSGINGSMPCALDGTGPGCVDLCIQQTCIGDASVSLYRALDQCAYCTTCASACSAYCTAFTDAGTACPVR